MSETIHSWASGAPSYSDVDLEPGLYALEGVLLSGAFSVAKVTRDPGSAPYLCDGVEVQDVPASETLGPALNPNVFTVTESGTYRLGRGRGSATLRFTP